MYIVIPAAALKAITVTTGIYQIRPKLKLNGDGVVNISVLLISDLQKKILTLLTGFKSMESLNADDFPAPISLFNIAKNGL